MSKGICQSCQHFHQYRPEGDAGRAKVECAVGWGGECHANPPVIPLTYEGRHDEYATGRWPMVYASGWCARHEKCPTPQPVASPPAVRPTPIPTDIVLKWNSLTGPVECWSCEQPFTPPVGPCLTYEGTWGFVCLACAEKLVPHAARDCRLLQAARKQSTKPPESPRKPQTDSRPIYRFKKPSGATSG